MLYRRSTTGIETCLIYDDVIYDVIMDLFCFIFMISYNQQSCVMIDCNLIYNFARLKEICKIGQLLDNKKIILREFILIS